MKNTILFVALSIVLLFLLIKVAIPGIGKLANLITATHINSSEDTDQAPPPPPRFLTTDGFTKDSSIEINGYASPNVTVILVTEGEESIIDTDASGAFEKKVSLKEGENKITAFAQDKAGNKSTSSDEITIFYDKTSPDVEIEKPLEGESFYGTGADRIEIKGKTEAEAKAYINDRLAITNEAGEFSIFLNLSEGENKITIKVVDQAGNETQKELTASYSR